MRDFTLRMYERLLSALRDEGYAFQAFEDFLGENRAKTVVLRHDVDRRPQNALRVALRERAQGIRSTYYFRHLRGVFEEEIIRNIADQGHEIGYHYECLSAHRGDHQAAIREFAEKLETIRMLYPVRTICMHGSPLSRYDNRDLWKKYDYRDYGIIGEPYFDVDFTEVLYLTDTGRRWDGENVSIRDKVGVGAGLKIKKTHDIIDHIDRLPPAVMLNIHPERWTKSSSAWVRELALQKIKNAVKFLIIKKKRKSKSAINN